MKEKHFGRWKSWPKEDRLSLQLPLDVRGWKNGVKAAGLMRLDSHEFMLRNGAGYIDIEDDAPIMSKWD